MSDTIKKEDYEKLTAKDYQKVLLEKDLAPLSVEKQTSFMLQNCEHLGINPIVRPFELIKFNGKSVLYLTASGCENIASNLAISFKILKKEVDRENGIASIEIEGVVPSMNGKPERRDVSTAYLPIGIASLKDGSMKIFTGLEFANTMMKLETKARRRLIIRLAGLRDEVYETEETFTTENNLVTSQVAEKETKGTQVVTVKSIEVKENTPPVIETYDNNNKDHKALLVKVLTELNFNIKENIEAAKAIAKACNEEKCPVDDMTIFKAFVQTKLSAIFTGV